MVKTVVPMKLCFFICVGGFLVAAAELVSASEIQITRVDETDESYPGAVDILGIGIQANISVLQISVAFRDIPDTVENDYRCLATLSPKMRPIPTYFLRANATGFHGEFRVSSEPPQAVNMAESHSNNLKVIFSAVRVDDAVLGSTRLTCIASAATGARDEIMVFHDQNPSAAAPAFGVALVAALSAAGWRRNR